MDFEPVNVNIDDFIGVCRMNGLKITPQRLEIYKVLAKTTEHPSADKVYKKVRETMPNVSLDTVNRTLKKFVELGTAFVVEGSGDVKRYDAGMASHQHFKCVKCKRIIDFCHIPFDNITLPDELLGNCKILKTTVYAEGICEKCQS